MLLIIELRPVDQMSKVIYTFSILFCFIIYLFLSSWAILQNLLRVDSVEIGL